MTLEWARAARRDLDRIWSFNAIHDVDRAARIEDALVAGAVGLLANPRKGRPGEAAGTRELSLPAVQYVLVYEIAGETVRIVRVWSTAERRRGTGLA